MINEWLSPPRSHALPGTGPPAGPHPWLTQLGTRDTHQALLMAIQGPVWPTHGKLLNLGLTSLHIKVLECPSMRQPPPHPSLLIQDPVY